MKSHIHNLRVVSAFLLFFCFITEVNAQTITQTYSSSGIFICPPGVTKITIETWGAGGAGGGVSVAGSSQGGGGGGGGGYNKLTNFTVVPGNSYTVTVGKGGSGGTGDGGNGGASYFSTSVCVANGGSGGGADNGSGGAGGSGLYHGGSGKAGVSGTPGGGGSSAGTSANGQDATSSSGATAPSGGGSGGSGSILFASNGGNGGIPGGGGGGGKTTIFSGSKTGGNGADGKVIITCVVDPCTTLYWAGKCSDISGGTTGTDFNTAANWSIDPNSYLTAGIAPSSCNDVVIHLQLTSLNSGTTITFSNSSNTIKSLNFYVKNISVGSDDIYEGGLRLANQSLTITNDINLYAENNFVNKTTQLTMDCNDNNSLFVYNGNLTTNAVNNGGGSGECIVYPFSNPVNTVNKGIFILRGNANPEGVGDDANPQLNKPATLVFDGTGIQTITNNNSNGYPIYLGFNTVIGETNNPTVKFTGSNSLGFKSINNLTINDNATLELEATQSVNRNGSGTPGTFTMGANSNLILKGDNFPSGYATAYNLNATSTVEYKSNDGISQNIAGVTYGNLKLTNATGSGNSTKNVIANFALKGNLTVNSNVTLNQSSYSISRSPAGGTFYLASASSHYLAGTYPSGFSSYSLNSNSTTNYNGSGAQNISPQNYGNLILSKAGNKTAVGSFTVSGNMNIENSSVFQGGSYAHYLFGNWNNNASFNAGSSTIHFVGSSNQNISGSSSTSFNNLVINKSNNSNTVSNGASEKAFSSVNLTIDKGNLILAATDNNYVVNGNLIVVPNGTLTHSVSWDATYKLLSIAGNLDITGVFNPTVRSHVAMFGAGTKTIRTGSNPSSTLSILTFSTGNYLANGPLKTNQEVWAMFGTAGSFSTNGNDVHFASLINNMGIVNVDGGLLEVAGNVQVGFSGNVGQLNVSNGVLNIHGSLYNNTGSNISISNSPQVFIQGDFVNNGSFVPGSSTMTFSGSVDEGISGSNPVSFYNLNVSGKKVVQNMNLIILNALSINSGELDLQDYTCNRNVSGGTMTLENGCTLTLHGGSGGVAGSNFPANFSTYAFNDGSTVKYNGLVSQTIFATPSYSNLTLANSGVKSAGGALTIRKNLLLENSSVFSGGTYNHKIGGDWTNNASATAYQYGTGKVTFNGGVSQNIQGVYGTSFNSLEMDNNSGITISSTSPVSVYESLTSTGAGKTLNTNDNLTMKSIETKTSRIGNMTGCVINGKVTVERYVSARKAWRFISVPTNSTQTIKEAWQEGALSGSSDPEPGYGTQITSERSDWASAGFDQKSYSPSMKYYDPVSDAWIGVNSTNATLISNTKGYMVFVRGDRLSTTVSSPVTETNLRTKGNVRIGTQPFISVLAGKYESVGNPYPSPIDFTKIIKGSGVSNVFYLWDPFMAGTYGVGGYQTFAAANGWKPVPGGTTTHPSGVASSIIQNGEAFFIHGNTGASSADLTIQFTESSKEDVNPVTFARPAGTEDVHSKSEFLRASLFSAGGVLLDANAVAFDKSFSNEVDGDDALKFSLSWENFGLKRLGKSLAVEARDNNSISDTIFYNMTNLQKQDYQIRIFPEGFGSSISSAYINDSYLNTTTPLSLVDSSIINFSVNNDSKSFATDRFKIIFSRLSALPVKFIGVSAIQQNENILVKWSSGEENNVAYYEIEHSLNGTDYYPVGKQAYNAALSGEYEWVDKNASPGLHFYRIRSIDKDGKGAISPVVRINLTDGFSGITIYPNPVVDKVLQIRFTRQPFGGYHIRILNSLGQEVETLNKNVQSENEVMKINWNTNLPRGIYNVFITSEKTGTVSYKVRY